jgi:hypothetical protein
MNKNMRLVLGLVAIALVVAFVGTVRADSLIINNGSFESPALDPGGSADITGEFNKGGWVQEYGGGTPSAWRPPTGAFPGSPDSLPSPADGSQCLSGMTDEIAVVQLLSYSNPVLGRIQPDTAYTLTVAVGAPTINPDGSPGQFQGVTIGLADNDAGAAIGGVGIDNLFQINPSWTKQTTGVWFDLSYTLSADDVNALLADPDDTGVYAGDAMALFIDCGGVGTVVDNIRMTATSAAVPEPSTFVLLASGLVGLLAYAWRKRK